MRRTSTDTPRSSTASPRARHDKDTQQPASFEAHLARQQAQDLLRFITCGSVDDGKSTLIGRLLWDSRQLFDDQLATLQAESRKYGTQGSDIDFALLVDGLSAEREQGITIDVAYRFFSTAKRKFIVADTPGHEQYTRNMVTGASNADVAVLLVDARKGLLTQTRRHAYLVSLMGIRHVALAINKMDLVGFKAETFQQIRDDFESFAHPWASRRSPPSPVRHRRRQHHRALPTHRGTSARPSSGIWNDQGRAPNTERFAFPVQWVNRPNSEFRGYCGNVTGERFA